jgi:hypothetical protein
VNSGASRRQEHGAVQTGASLMRGLPPLHRAPSSTRAPDRRIACSTPRSAWIEQRGRRTVARPAMCTRRQEAVPRRVTELVSRSRSV